MGQIDSTSEQGNSDTIIIMMKSKNSTIEMKVNQYETMGTIASRYCMRDAGLPSSGLNLYYNGREIQGDETPNSLKMKNGSVCIVRW